MTEGSGTSLQSQVEGKLGAILDPALPCGSLGMYPYHLGLSLQDEGERDLLVVFPGPKVALTEGLRHCLKSTGMPQPMRK